MSTTRSAPLAMRPAGFAGRLFGVAMEWLNAPAYRLALEMLAPKPAERILEIGFGTGRLLELLVPRLPHGALAGIDPTQTMLDVARRRLRGAGGRVDLRLGDAAALPWPTQHFDAVVALHCFQFWPAPDASLAEVARVLRPGGRFALILRRHGGQPPAWLPNPISRSGDEVNGTRACVRDAGFVLTADPTPRWPTHAILARRVEPGGGVVRPVPRPAG